MRFFDPGRISKIVRGSNVAAGRREGLKETGL
jgi:hypothetical protein